MNRGDTVQTRRGENLGELGLLDLRGLWHDQVVLPRSAKSNVVAGHVKQSNQGGRDGVYLIVGHAARDVFAVDARSVQPAFEFFEAGAISQYPEDVLRRSRVALDDRESTLSELVGQAHAAHRQPLHGW